MTDPIIECPQCTHKIKLTDSLAAPLVQATRAEYEKKLSLTQNQFLEKEKLLNLEKKKLEQQQALIDETVNEKLRTARTEIEQQAFQKAGQAVQFELEQKNKDMKELQNSLQEKNKQLGDALKTEADYLKKQRELEDKERALEVEVEKRINASLSSERQKAKKEAEDELNLKVSEKEEQISSMKRQIDDLKRKAEQGSQQLQGEVMELMLEETLKSAFMWDKIDPVAKGELGADILQSVMSTIGADCGKILWEVKRTKNWSDAWIPKLKTDQRTANAYFSILVTQALPKGLSSFGQVDGVWVCGADYALPLVSALRQTLIEVANSKKSQEGQQTKMEMVYDYLTSSRFRHRIEAIVEKFSDMKNDLDRERKAMTKLWAKREIQILSVIESTVGLYGDLQGIAGKALQEIEGLDLPLLDHNDEL